MFRSQSPFPLQLPRQDGSPDKEMIGKADALRSCMVYFYDATLVWFSFLVYHCPDLQLHPGIGQPQSSLSKLASSMVVLNGRGEGGEGRGITVMGEL